MQLELHAITETRGGIPPGTDSSLFPKMEILRAVLDFLLPLVLLGLLHLR